MGWILYALLWLFRSSCLHEVKTKFRQCEQRLVTRSADAVCTAWVAIKRVLSKLRTENCLGEAKA